MWRWVLTEIDPVNLPPVLTVADALDPASLRADIEHIKWVLFQTRERTGGGNDTISDLEMNNNGDNSLFAQVGWLKTRVDELEAQLTGTKLVTRKLEEIEMQLARLRPVQVQEPQSATKELPMVLKRLSDLELQQ